MEYFKTLFKNLAGLVGRMTPSQVMMLFGIVAGTIVGAVLLIGWVGDATYSRLYSNIDEAEAGEIVNYLSENAIPYKLSNNGTSIDVPSKDVYATRISLASQGLPRSGTVGYSIFDKNNLGMTDFLQNLNYRRALEGELTRTITQIGEVKAARVHIVMPKERLFKEDRKEATASVLLKLTSRAGLTKQQLNGISHLVAASVEGLKPENIAIIDYDGNLLSSGQNADALAGLSSTQLELRKNVESYLESKAQSLLDGVLGPGNALVRVTAELDFQQLETTSETYDPNTPSIRSEQTTTSSSTTSDKNKDENESSEEGSDETTITNYELSKTVEHAINAVGGIDRLSVAVMVDGTYQDVEGASGAMEKVYQPRPQEELDRLSAIVKNAVGFDQQRNDQMEMVNISFDRRDLETDQDALDSMYLREFYMDIARKVGLVLLALIGFLYLKKKSRKLFSALGKLSPPVVMKPVTVSTGESGESGESRENNEEEEAPPMEVRKPRLVDQMQKAARDHPEEVARVIKTMMVE